MNLYIFEPYEWAYCGGAIGIIARTFDESVETVVKNGNNRYKRKYFSTNTETFVNDGVNQWLLTYTIPLPGTYIIPEVMFNNWNFA